MVKKYLIIIFILDFAFILTSCGTSTRYTRSDDQKDIKSIAVKTIEKYQYMQCNLFVQDVLKQSGITVTGSSNDMIVFFEKSPNWRKIRETDISRYVEQGKIVVATQKQPRNGQYGHVAFAFENSFGKNSNNTIVLGTYKRHIAPAENEFHKENGDFDPPIFYYLYMGK